jgi:hypothetical protein
MERIKAKDAITARHLNCVFPRNGKTLGKFIVPRINPIMFPTPVKTAAHAFATCCWWIGTLSTINALELACTVDPIPVSLIDKDLGRRLTGSHRKVENIYHNDSQKLRDTRNSIGKPAKYSSYYVF